MWKGAAEEREWERASKRKDKSANRFSLFTKRRRGTRWRAHERERESLKGTDYVLHVVLLVVVVTDDHNMDCVHDVKHTYRFFTRFHSQAFFYLLFNRPKLKFCSNYRMLLLLLIICDFILFKIEIKLFTHQKFKKKKHLPPQYVYINLEQKLYIAFTVVSWSSRSDEKLRINFCITWYQIPIMCDVHVCVDRLTRMDIL